DLGPERELGERDREIAVEVGALAREQLVLAQTDEDVQIPGRSAVQAPRARAAQPHLHAVLDPRGDLDLQQPLGARPALPAARLAWCPDALAFAATLRARPRDGEEAL